MLAVTGFLVAERFHPLFGGGIDMPSYVAFQATPLQEYWKATLSVIGVVEIASINSFMFPVSSGWAEGKQYYKFWPWMIDEAHAPGDFGFDPAGLKPKDAADFKAMQTKGAPRRASSSSLPSRTSHSHLPSLYSLARMHTELNNGRLAMVAVVGMVAQELATGTKLW